MSFGIEIRDENGRDVFSVGRKYFRIVGEISFPAASSSSPTVLESSFQLPASVPTDEEPFIKISVLEGAKSYLLQGRTVRIQHIGHYEGLTYYRHPAKVYYGFYA